MTAITTAAPAANSAPNKTTPSPVAGKDEKAWRAEIHTAPEYNGNLPVADVVPDPQNRKEHDAGKLEELLASIKADGLQQPIVVRPVTKYPEAVVLPTTKGDFEVFRDSKMPEVARSGLLYSTRDKQDAERAAAIYRSGQGWQIIAGERRWRAHVLGGLKTIAARIDRGDGDVAAVRKQVAENLLREDLDPIEEARQMKRLSDLGESQKEIGKLFGGRSQPVVAQTLNLLKLPAAAQALVASGALSPAHAAELVRFSAWPKACAFIAKEVATPDQSGDSWSAKDLRDKPLVASEQLVEAGMAVSIYVGDYPYGDRVQYKISTELQKSPGFFKTGYNEWTYLFPEDGSPNLWEPEKKKQDLAREAAAKLKAQKTVEAKKAGKPSKEQKERAEKLEKNKKARAAISGTLAHAVQTLREADGVHVDALAVVCDNVLAGGDARLEDAAAALGFKLPLKLGAGYADLDELRKLGAEKMLKLAAVSIMLAECESATRFAGAVPDSASFVAGKKAKTAVDTSVQVTVKSKGSDYKAKAGNAEASSTSGADCAARAAAAKHFSTNSAFIDLLTVREGKANGEAWVYTATKFEKGGKK